MIARRDGKRVRLYTRRGYDWSAKYPRIVEALLSLRVRSIIVDGEAVWAGKDGKSDLDRLHSGGHDVQVFLYLSRIKALEWDWNGGIVQAFYSVLNIGVSYAWLNSSFLFCSTHSHDRIRHRR